jgi:hypothetical protein
MFEALQKDFGLRNRTVVGAKILQNALLSGDNIPRSLASN